MDKVWQTVNGVRTLLLLLGMLVAGALWAQGLANRVDKMDEFGTAAGRRQERRLQRMERNLIRLGERWDIPMEEPPEAAP